MDTLLIYDLITDPFPLQASPQQSDPTRANKAVLTITATNTTKEDILLMGISIRIPVGSGSGQLTNNAGSISAATPPGWTLQPVQFPAGGAIFSFSPAVNDTLESNDSVNFVFSNIHVNEQTGTVGIKITEAGEKASLLTESLFVTKFPYGWGKVEFSLHPSTLEYGGSTRLKWKGPEKATYTIEYYSPEKQKIVRVPKAGDPALSNDGTWPAKTEPALVLQHSNVFTMTVVQAIGTTVYTAQDQKIAIVAPPPPPEIEWFRASAEVMDFTSGPKKVTLTWKTKNATYLEIEGYDIVTSKEKFETRIGVTTRFALKATNRFGDTALKPLVVQSVQDMLAYNTFEMHEYEMIHWAKGHVWSKTLHEKFTFDPEGTGKYYYHLSGEGLPKHLPPFPTQTAELTFNWNRAGDKVTVSFANGNKVNFTIAPSTLKYENAYSQDIRREKNMLERKLLPNRRGTE